MNAFVKPAEQYIRDIDVLTHYVQHASSYLSISTGRSIEECTAFINRTVSPTGPYPFKDPALVHLHRQENGDRVKVDSTVYTYLKDAITNKDIIAPTFTTYINSSKKKSVLALYVDVNIKARGVAKRAMFAAKSKDNNLFNVKKIEQTGKKLDNNGISGAHVSPSNPLYNKTAHSTLTSACRITSGYGNANNEKLLSGNRHYYNMHIVINNIISTINNTNYNLLEHVILKHGLVYPTVEQTMQCITYSTNLYWWERNYLAKIQSLVEKLTPLQRAAFVYIGDFYQLMRLNPEFVRFYISKLSNKVTTDLSNPDEVIKSAHESYLNLAHQICSKETKGIGKDYSSIKGTEKYITLASTVKNISDTIIEYTDLIEALFLTTNVPAAVASFPESMRRSAITGDTDSTIFTVQDWVIWYKHGVNLFDDEAISVEAAVVFMASSTITHVLATMSANFGIATEHIFRIEMKSEYRFDVFIPTNLGKHYFASIGCQEGNVFAKQETEIKGVYLKSSNLPKELSVAAKKMMEDIMSTIMSGNKISVQKYLTEVSGIEREIIASVKRGEHKYLRSGSVKEADSYTKGEENSPYQIHTFWNTVFGPKYGEMVEPPYSTIKVSLVLDNPTRLKEWVDGMVDREMAQRMTDWIVKKSKRDITTFYVPLQILQIRGFPIEIIEVIDYRKIVSDLCFIFYLILETMGIYLNEDKVKRLVSDYY